MPHTRTIAVLTGSRADFGLLTPVMRAIADHPNLVLRTLVAGAHLLQKTYPDITAAGFAIDAQIPMQKPHDTGRHADTHAIARGIDNLATTLSNLKPTPNVLLVLGDRIEALAAAIATSVGGIHLAHIHGGDRAQGVADEAIRHAISKFAHIHFPATAKSRRRLIRMGEHQEHVFNTGSPAIDQLANITPDPAAPDLIILQHPVADTIPNERRHMHNTLAATENFSRLVLASNADPGAPGILAALQEENINTVSHLPRNEFLAKLAGAKAIVGNSSAALIEAAALKIPAVNIGPRQDGREKPKNVIDTDYDTQNIRAAINTALAKNLSRIKHPYGNGDTGPQIANHLATLDLDTIPLKKQNAY